MAKRITVVEDEPGIVESLRFLLGRAGYEVSIETDGKAALAALTENPPDAAVLDVMLPGMDGYQILRTLRATPGTETLPVLILTAKGQREDRETALTLGADRFITKPFSNAEIVEAVGELVSNEPV